MVTRYALIDAERFADAAKALDALALRRKSSDTVFTDADTVFTDADTVFTDAEKPPQKIV